MNIVEIFLVLLSLLIYLLFPYACYKLAEKKGMNKTIAFMVGFFLAFPALIYYFHCPSREEKERWKQEEEKELKKQINERKN